MCRGQSSRHVAKNCGLLPEVSKDTADTSQTLYVTESMAANSCHSLS